MSKQDSGRLVQLGVGARVAKALRRLRGSLERRAVIRQLARVRRRMLAEPPRTTGVENVFGYSVRVLDGPSFYTQYKDIFVNLIYDFEPPRSNPLVIDGGANIGMSVLRFKQEYPEARVICFEPDPACFKILKENVFRNGLSGVTLVNSGLGHVEGVEAFLPDNADGGRLGTGEAAIEVEVRPLSMYLMESVDFLKLNVEGEELSILEEAESSGRLRNVQQMVLEYHGWPDAPQRLGRILELLDRNGFRYMVNDFDAETCASSKPPFRMNSHTMWFCLVYARRMEAPPPEG